MHCITGLAATPDYTFLGRNTGGRLWAHCLWRPPEVSRILNHIPQPPGEVADAMAPNMSRAAPPLPITPKLFKHFATLTIVITVCVAVFADGEGREMVTEQVAAVEAQNRVLKVEAQKLGERHLGAGKMHFRPEKRSHLAFAPDAPEQSETNLESYAEARPARQRPAGTIGCNRQAQPQSHRSPQRCPPPASGNMAANPGQSGTPPQNGPSEDQIAKIEEASRARSGS